MDRWRLRCQIAALAAASLAALASAETRPHYGGAIDASLLGSPGSLEPLAAQTHAEITAIQLLYDTLYALGSDGAPVPLLAAGLPELDAAHTTARIRIRAGVRFHDGSELTIHDVIASLERTRASTGRWALAAISNLRADGEVLEVSLRAPVPDLATWLALPQTAIAKPVRGGASGPTASIGSGPFAIAGYEPGTHRLQLKAFDDYFGGRAYLDAVTLHWYDTPDGEARDFETGAAQWSARGAASFAGAQPLYRAAALEGAAAVMIFVGFGHAHAAETDDRGFRHALDLALGRAALTTVGNGEHVMPTRVPLPAEAGGAALDAAGGGENLDGARAQLAAAAKKNPALAPAALAAGRLEVLVEATRPDDREIGERVVRALDQLGIPAVVSAVAANDLRDRVASGRCDLWIGQLAEPVSSAPVWWAAAFAAGGDSWASGPLAAGHLVGADARAAFAERLPVLPLMFRGVRIWRRSDIRGLGFDDSGRPDFADLFLFGDPVRAGGGGKARP